VCVCLCAKYSKKLWTDYDEIFKGGGRGQGNNHLDFGGDPEHDPDPGILKRILYLLLRFLYIVKNKT